ncbi:MAG: tetratricopeptide repeat protein, partial [Candidatus Omnitrophica bacterium]|nr:tetratricopeptide repeat protein [Candidatus Omnitrophota bacterium]
MMKKICFYALLSCSLFLNLATPAYAVSAVSEYLCQLGTTLYDMGKYDDALEEFRKVLLVEPNNVTAQQYINEIFQREKAQPVNTMGKSCTREEAMNYTFAQLDKKPSKTESVG